MIKKNITYGLIVLIPVAIIVLLLAKIVEVLKTMGEPLGLQSLVATALADCIGHPAVARAVLRRWLPRA